MSTYLLAPEITDEVIEAAFEGTNFGRTDYRYYLGYSVLQTACGWHCGYTITTIMIDLGLITPKTKNLTKLGKRFLTDCYPEKPETVRALEANPVVVPDGWKLVPVEMTDEIGEAIAFEASCCGGIALDIYEAMLKAAPVYGGEGEVEE